MVLLHARPAGRPPADVYARREGPRLRLLRLLRHEPLHGQLRRAPPGRADREDVAGHVELLFLNKKGSCIGRETQSTWLRPCAPGFRDLLFWISKRYSFPKIYVTENGTSVKGENNLPLEHILDDGFRAEYFQDYVGAMTSAASLDGVDVRGYFAWSLMDNFEWHEGYETRFGACYDDYETGQRRYPKKSAKCLKPLFDSLIKG